MSEKRPSHPYRDVFEFATVIRRDVKGAPIEQLDEFARSMRILVLSPDLLATTPRMRLVALSVLVDEIHVGILRDVATRRGRTVAFAALLGASVPLAVKWLPDLWALFVPALMVGIAFGAAMSVVLLDRGAVTGAHFGRLYASLERYLAGRPDDPTGVRVAAGATGDQVVASAVEDLAAMATPDPEKATR